MYSPSKLLSRCACTLIFLSALLTSAYGIAQEAADYTALGDPSYAQSLGLSDEQIAQIAVILDRRRNQIVAAKPEERDAVFADANKKLALLLTDAQKRSFGALVSGGKLRFSFRNEPWSDVLQWFSGQADLALMMNEAPPGDFTYSDAKNHTPAQAIDLLNSVLQSKGYTLVRREKMLIVARTSDGLPYDLVPKIQLDELPQRGRFEYVNVMFPMTGRPLDKVSQEVTAFLGPNARATPLPSTNQLMVVDTAGRVNAIHKLIESIPLPAKPKPKPKPQPKPPKPKPPSPVFQVHSSKGLNVDAAMDTLKKLYGDAKLVGDARAEQITAYTVPQRQDAIGKTLAQMMANVSGDNAPYLETYSVDDQNLEQLQSLLAQANPGLQISGDSSNNRLFVVGDADQQRGVVQTLEKLDAVQVGDGKNSVGVYEVDPELADKIVTLLEPLIPRASVVHNAGRIAIRGSATDQQIAKSAIAQFQDAEDKIEKPQLRFYALQARIEGRYLESAKQVAPKARVSEVPDRNQLAIVSTKEDYDRIVQAIDRIQQQLGQPAKTMLSKVEVTVEDPNRLLSMLQREFPGTRMMLNDQRDALLFWAAEDDMQQFQTKLDEFVAILPAKRQGSWKAYPTKTMSGDDIQSLVQPVVKNARFKADDLRKRMIIWATTEEHAKIGETLTAFLGDAADAADFESVVLGYSINRGDAEAMVSMLSPLHPKASLVADNRANKILVTAPLDEQRRIEAVIRQLDVEPGQGNEIARSYTISGMPSTTLLKLLLPSFPDMRLTSSGTRGKQIAAFGSARDHERLKKMIDQLDNAETNGRVEVYDVGSSTPSRARLVLMQLVPSAVISTADDKVIVWAEDEGHKTIEAAVKKFEEDTSNKQTKIYKLKHADPDTAEYILRDLIRGARFAEDDDNRTLMATATPEQHEEIASIIEQMDQPNETGRITEIYRFDRIDARSAELALERLAPRARISRLYGVNAVIASATAEEHKLFAEAVEKINGGEKTSVTKVYPLDKKQLNVDDVLASIDDSLKSRVSIRMNEQLNSLIVRGTEEDQQKIKGLIDELVAQVPIKPQREAKVYSIEHAQPEVVADVLRDLINEASFRSDRQTGTVTATAFPEDHAQIATIVKQLDIPGQQTQQTTEIYRFDRTDSRSAERAFERLVPRARVSSIYGTNSVVVTATSAEHAIFRETAEKLNGDGTTSETRVYALDKDQINVDDVLASIDDSLKSRVAVRMNEQLNSLIVRASAEDQATMKGLIDELIAQVPAKPKRDAKVYSIEHAQPEVVADVLRDLIDDAGFRSDEQTGTVTATAYPKDHAQIATIVKQLDIPGQQTQQTTEIYRFDRTDSRAAERAFERLVPRARVSSIYGTNSVVVTATSAEHAIFQDTAEKLNGGGTKSETRVYALDKDQINVDDVLASIDDSLKSRVAVRMNEQLNSLIVRASAEDQATMKQLIDELIAQVPPMRDRVAKVYQFKNGRAESSRYALRDMFSDATISFDERNNTLIATATEEEHGRLANLVTQLDQPSTNDKSTKIYRLDSIPASSIQSVISNLVPDGGVTYDTTTNHIIVTADEAEHEKVAAAIVNVNGADGSETVDQVYSLKSANPSNLQSSIERLMPHVRVASDQTSGTLIVSAKPADQQRVKELVDQLEAAPGQESSMRAYVVNNADGKRTFDSLQKTFAGNANFGISFQEATKTIFLVATPKNHDVFKKLLEQLDLPELSTAGRTAQPYALANMSANVAKATVTALLQGTVPPANVEVDEFGSSLILIGTQEQHARVGKALGQLGGEGSELEVFELSYVDPWTVESAVDDLYFNLPANAAPTITSDYFSDRLFVRGTTKQIEEVRVLLRKMGERSVATRDEKQGGDVRTIPFRGDVEDAVKQIQQIWPRIRKNRIQVIAPSDPTFKVEPTTPSVESPLRLNDETAPISVPVEEEEEAGRSVRTTSTLTRYVAQTTTRAPAAPEEAADTETAAPENTVAEAVAAEPAVATQPAQEPGNSAIQVSGTPIVIVPDEGRITIASSDHAALDELEELLSVLARTDSEDTNMGSDFAVYLLRNTGASEMRALLSDLFEQLRKNAGGESSSGPASRRGGGSSRSSASSSGSSFGGFASLFGPSFANVAVVADDRLNALIIHGDRKERELIKELLSLLDSEDLKNPIIVFQPELIRLENTQANRVMGILTNVYKAQLSSGGRGRTKIPEGVSEEVASILRQINAAASAPVLTLDVDQTTNSIVMRAPPELRKEIKVFVESLDKNAGDNRSRNVRVIRLRKGKSDQIRDALEQFILDRQRK